MDLSVGLSIGVRCRPGCSVGLQWSGCSEDAAAQAFVELKIVRRRVDDRELVLSFRDV